MRGANVESKTRVTDIDAVARVVARLGGRYEGRLDQVDTYFRVPHGRLKLREISDRAADGQVSTSCELIRYERPDEGGARISRYERTELDDAERHKARLVAYHGLRGYVRKRRELWIIDSTRVHLDRVEGLGDFVELETVSAGTPVAADRLEHDRLAVALGLDPHATVEGSYIDLHAPLARGPRQNRVSPLSELIADPSRGLVYGNRGCLHDQSGRVRRRYNGKRWIACRLEFRGWRRGPLLQPGRFTELFFLDEATAFAAGHRPCALCRREDYRRFGEIWRDVHPGQVGADAIDAQLHTERIDPETNVQLRRRVPIDELPDGTFVLAQDVPWLVLGSELIRWTPAGYAERRRRPHGDEALLITPPSLVPLLRSGWESALPLLHPSALDD